MKALAIVLLAFIAAAVGYLAYTQYQSRRAAAEALDQLTDPEGYAARSWARSAGLRCDVITGVDARRTSGGYLRPMHFKCFATNYSAWIVEDVECPSIERPHRSIGKDWLLGDVPADGKIYWPLSTVCWVTRPAK